MDANDNPEEVSPEMNGPALNIGTPLAERAKRLLDEHTQIVTIDDRRQHAFSARALWEWLEQPWGKFNDWWQKARKRQNLKEGKEFVCYHESSQQTGGSQTGRGGKNKKDFLLTCQAAKQVVASDSSERGRAFLRALLDLADRVEQADPALVDAISRRAEELHGIARHDLPWHKRLSTCILDHIALVVTNHLDGFTVIMEAYPFLQAMELSLVEHLLPTFSSDMADGSIALCWSNYRFAKGRSRLEPKWTARVTLPGKGEVPVIVYPVSERDEFRRWLVQVYMPEKCAKYFKAKYKGTLENMAPLSAADMACRRIAGKPASLTQRERLTLEEAGGIIKADDRLLGG